MRLNIGASQQANSKLPFLSLGALYTTPTLFLAIKKLNTPETVHCPNMVFITLSKPDSPENPIMNITQCCIIMLASLATTMTHGGDQKRTTDRIVEPSLIDSFSVDHQRSPSNPDTTTPAMSTCPSNQVINIKWRPDGQELAIAIASGNGSDGCPYNGTVQRFSVENIDKEGQHVTLTKTLDKARNWVWELAYSHDGKYLAAASADTITRIYDITDPDSSTKSLSGTSQGLRTVAFHPHNYQFAMAGSDGFVVIERSLDKELQNAHLSDAKKRIRSVTYNHDGSLIASGGDENIVRIYDGNNPESVIHTLNPTGTAIWNMAFHPTKNQLAAVSSSGNLNIFNDLNNPTPSTTLTDSIGIIWGVTYNPDGKTLATASADGKVRIYNADSPDTPIYTVDDASSAWSLAYSPNGQWLAVGDKDGTVRIYRVRAATQLPQQDTATPQVHSTRNPVANSGSRATSLTLMTSVVVMIWRTFVP